MNIGNNVMRSNPFGSSSIGGAPLESADAEPPRELTPASLLLVLLLAYFMFRIRLVVELTIVAVFYATLIEYPIRAVEQRGLSRRAAILLIDAILVAGLLLPIIALAPTASQELDRFRQEEPASLRTLDATWKTSSNPLLRGPGRQAIERVIPLIEQPSASPKATVSIATRMVGIVVSVVVCFTIAFYYLMEKDLLRSLLIETVHPRSRPRVERMWTAAEHSVGGWLLGRLLLGVIVGIGSTLVFGLLGLPHWPLLGLLAGLTEPVPILGPWIGGIPAAFVALRVSWWMPLVVVGFILIRQSLVDTILVPQITKETLGLSPLVVFLSVVTGTELLGWLGALLAIPIAAVIQVVVRDYFAARRAADTSVASSWRWLRPSGPSPPGSGQVGDDHDVQDR
jgi:predicted PurR-regulated permease PerM